MSTSKEANLFVAVIGAGPAGLYAAQTLAEAGVRVALFNRDIKPGGLAEYGIYHDKQKMKDGLRRQFREILSNPAIDYYGNVVVGNHGDLTLDDLRQLGAEAILVTVGAQGIKWLGLSGEDLLGVYHAKDIVYHYNQLPPYTEQPFRIGRRVALVGAGNVMMDIAHWLIRDVQVDEIIAVVRRGPAEVKFSKKEMLPVICHVDRQALNQEFERVTPVMLNIGQDPVAAKTFMLSAGDKGIEPTSQTVFRFDFLASPSRIEGDAQGNVCALEVEDTTLVPANGDTKAKGLGTRRLIEVDTVVFCIGDRVDSDFGLPVEWNEYVKNPTPRFPVDGLSYEVFDPATSQMVDAAPAGEPISLTRIYAGPDGFAKLIEEFAGGSRVFGVGFFFGSSVDTMMTAAAVMSTLTPPRTARPIFIAMPPPDFCCDSIIGKLRIGPRPCATSCAV